jgi:hypothetical protein
MILRYPVLQGHVAEHSGLLLIVSTHKTMIGENVQVREVVSAFFNKFLN